MDEESRTLTELVKKVTAKMDDGKKRSRFIKTLNAFLKLSKGKREELVRYEVREFLKRMRRIRECLDKGGDVRRCGNPIQYMIDWLDTPSGFIAYSYIWKPGFAEKMLSLVITSIHAAASVINYYLGSGRARNTK